MKHFLVALIVVAFNVGCTSLSKSPERDLASTHCKLESGVKINIGEAHDLKNPKELFFPLIEASGNNSYQKAPYRFGSERAGEKVSVGSDIISQECQPVRAIAGGMVERAYEYGQAGTALVTIRHLDGTYAEYNGLHFQRTMLTNGELDVETHVLAGEIIGFLKPWGSTRVPMLRLKIYSRDFEDPTSILDHSRKE